MKTFTLLYVVFLTCSITLTTYAATGDSCNLQMPQTCGLGFKCASENSAPATCQPSMAGDACNTTVPGICGSSLECRPVAPGNVIGTCEPVSAPGTQTSPTSPPSGNQQVGTNNQSGASGGAIENPLTNTPSLMALLNTLLGAIVQLAAIGLVLMLVWVGFLFVQAQGKEEKIKAARHTLYWVVIGGLILLGAQTISLIIEATAGQL